MQLTVEENYDELIRRENNATRRGMLCDLMAFRFDADIIKQFAALFERIDDPDCLDDMCDWIDDRRYTKAQLLRRVEELCPSEQKHSAAEGSRQAHRLESETSQGGGDDKERTARQLAQDDHQKDIIRQCNNALDEGREEGMRQILCHLAASRFDADAARYLDVLLELIEDPDRLKDVAEWTLNGDTKEEFLRRVEGAAFREGDDRKGAFMARLIERNYKRRVKRKCDEARMIELDEMHKDALEVGGADGLVLMRGWVRRLAAMRFGADITERLGPLLERIDDLNCLDELGESIHNDVYTKMRFLRRVWDLPRKIAACRAGAT